MGRGQLLGEAFVRISYDDLRKLDLKIDESGRKFTAQTDKMTTALKGMTAIIGTVGVAKFGSDIISASTKMDTLNRMLINVEGNQEKANKRFDQFRILAKEPVLDPFNLSRFYVGLKSVNVESELSIRFMKSLANSMAGVGAGNTEFVRSMEQVVQMMGKATLQGQDLRVMAESFPQIRKYLAEAFGGLTDPEAIAKAGNTSIDVLTKLNAAMEKAPKFAGGAQAAQDNFTQSLQLFYATLGKDVLPIVTDFLNKLTNLMDEFGKLDASTKKVIGTAVVGGVGLLGIASTVGAIKIALDGLGMSAGLKALTSGALAGGASKGLGSIAGMAVGGSALGAIGAVGAAAGAVTWMVHEVHMAATRVDLVGPMSTAGAKAEITGQRQALTKELGLYGQNQKLSEVLEGGDLVKMDRLFKEAGLDMSRYIFMSFNQALDSINTTWANATGGKKQPKYVNKPLDITNPEALTKSVGTGFESLLEEAKKFSDIQSKEYNASDTEQLKFWQSKLDLPLTPEARTGILNTISGLQDDINKTLKEKADDREKIWFEHAEAIAKQTVMNTLRICFLLSLRRLDIRVESNIRIILRKQAASLLQWKIDMEW